jgi:hypothetical protein
MRLAVELLACFLVVVCGAGPQDWSSVGWTVRAVVVLPSLGFGRSPSKPGVPVSRHRAFHVSYPLVAVRGAGVGSHGVGML